MNMPMFITGTQNGKVLSHFFFKYYGHVQQTNDDKNTENINELFSMIKELFNFR